MRIATYDANNNPDIMMAAWGGQCEGNESNIDMGKMQVVAFEQVTNTYRTVGRVVGKAWSIGEKFNK